MIEYGVIAVLVLVILMMAWVWYIQPKSKNKKVNKTIESLKDEFDSKYHTLIENIIGYEPSYDACKGLLTHIQKLNEKKVLHEEEITEDQTTNSEVSNNLDQKSHVIMQLSHQMRTSLSGLLGFTQFLKETKLTEEQKEYVKIIATSSDELLTLLSNIIDIIPKGRIFNHVKTTKMSKNMMPPSSNTKIPYVLVVDDNEINKRLLAKVLEHENLKVIYASNGEEAVALREKNDFDVIFMDIQMPVMNGLEASKAIRKYEEKQNIAPVSIIALTANTGKHDRDTYFDAGMTDYMVKPIMIDDVRERIAQL